MQSTNNPTKVLKTSLGKEQLRDSSETPIPNQLALDDTDLSYDFRSSVSDYVYVIPLKKLRHDTFHK